MSDKLIYLFLIVLFSCGSSEPPKNPLPSHYTFKEPETKWELPGELKEISGLELLSDTVALAINDEQGKLFFLNLDQQEVTNELDWGFMGDYEGVAAVEQQVYIIQSDGDLFEFSLDSVNRVVKYETGLSGKHNVEGLCYDKIKNRLLIACKGSGGTDEGKRKIFEYDLSEGKLQQEPVLEIEMEVVEEMLISNGLENLSRNLRKSLQRNEVIFEPSGIAINPQNGWYYIISAENNLLIALNETGQVRELQMLNHRDFLQPEGIAFAASGDIYIANEGKKGKPNVLRFTYQDK